MNLPLLNISFLLFISIFVTTCSSIKICRHNDPCLPLDHCPKMLSLYNDPTPDNLAKVKQEICAIRGRRRYVCCPEHPNKHLLPTDCGHQLTEDRIVGGEPAPLGAYPWMVAFGYTEIGDDVLQFVCGGTLISSRYVLTAAHCLHPKNLGRKRLKVLRLGEHNLSTERDCEETVLGQRCAEPFIAAGVEETSLHPRYDTRSLSSDDIALVRINVTIDFDTEKANVYPICLPSSKIDLRSLNSQHQKPVAAGWGTTEHGSSSNILLSVRLPIVSDEICKNLYSAEYVSGQICVGGEKMNDTCSGDSGGPLIIPKPYGPPYTQVGIVSYGPSPCGGKNMPSVFTKVDEYMDWIMDTIKP